MSATKSDQSERTWRLFAVRIASAAAFPVFAYAVALAGAVATKEISQRGRMFDPGEVELNKGDTLRIVNNDADLLHHAYVDAPTFKFDSGEQEPGSRVEITFTQRGTFEVLCGIHPKMRLDVTVK
jgi:plastocyanin